MAETITQKRKGRRTRAQLAEPFTPAPTPTEYQGINFNSLVLWVVFLSVHGTDQPIAIFAIREDADDYVARRGDLQLAVRGCATRSDFLPYARLLLYADLSGVR